MIHRRSFDRALASCSSLLVFGGLLLVQRGLSARGIKADGRALAAPRASVHAMASILYANAYSCAHILLEKVRSPPPLEEHAVARGSYPSRRCVLSMSRNIRLCNELPWMVLKVSGKPARAAVRALSVARRQRDAESSVGTCTTLPCSGNDGRRWPVAAHRVDRAGEVVCQCCMALL